MIPTRLVQHYEAKYAAERTAPPPEPLPVRAPRPADRCAAAVTTLARLLPHGADVLELGAGNGVVAESLRAGGVPFRGYTIGDISTPRLEGLRRTLTDPRMRFAQVDAEQPTATVDGPFDAVVMIALIEHLIDPLGAMRKIRGLLKPGGFVYIDTPNIAKWTRRLKLAAGRFPSTASANEGLTTYGGAAADLHDEGHLHYFTHRSLALMLTRRCGYTEVEFHPYFQSPRILGRRTGTLLARTRPTLFSEIACVARIPSDGGLPAPATAPDGAVRR
ncbi:class I SAM-dependent methyltransferase [Streptomyces jeddahensis]|uniref:Ubiquinone biosynthesis O-methyltransferase n=1 Tax=Streptomyces jeddahensis TaxID=1716141 RepID=A0A177HFD5_9ACTN|nr:class I SAM-dependent methyltransferase [Streptomyces jeddahensis]OAH09621.1 ubiquinone biosynthesis O-methyltransferase [Streptomyces jeddahensis]